MKTLSILSQKGGAGKTTLAIHLAVAAELSGQQTALIDIDPQASATSWGDSREQESPVVVSAQSSRLEKVLEAAREAGAKLAIIDTAPHSESASLVAARAADFILIPCRPAILDLRAIGSTIDLVKIADKPASIILNTVPPRGGLAEDAKKAIAIYEISVCPVYIKNRAAFSNSLTAGLTAQEYEPQGKAAAEIKQLYKWICKQMNIK
ncbi:MAG: ParA family partition ATPase [Snowella sp.]|nr:ParA family partition ATPase [Snowella sp.]